jgi:hypothetical protein
MERKSCPILSESTLKTNGRSAAEYRLMALPKADAKVGRHRFLTGVMASQHVPAQRISCQGMFGGTSAPLIEIALQHNHLRSIWSPTRGAILANVRSLENESLGLHQIILALESATPFSSPAK